MRFVFRWIALLILALPLPLAACGEALLGLGPDREIILRVADRKVDCVGAFPQTCLLVQEEGSTEWTYFYDGIEGFTHEQGYNYILRVRITPIDNPPQDSSSVRYELVQLISKEISAQD